MAKMKRGAKVVVQSQRNGGEARNGVFVKTHTGLTGDFYEIKFADGSTMKARPARVDLQA